MTHKLDNPFWNAMNTDHLNMTEGNNEVRRYLPTISPFTAAKEYTPSAFDGMVKLSMPGDFMVVAGEYDAPKHPNLVVHHFAPYQQMVYGSDRFNPPEEDEVAPIVTLTPANVPEMIDLVKLTRPGPFAQRTIEFGDYFGIFQDDQLVAMAGERAHLPGYAEVSAVCTRPGYEGRGYASRLIRQVMQGMLARNDIPFLHVATNNDRAISVYERYGFRKRIGLNGLFAERI